MTRRLAARMVAALLGALLAPGCLAAPAGPPAGGEAVACGDARVATIVAVRHAEAAADGTDDPGLAEEGRVRAGLLAGRLRDAGVTAVWSSELRRARETAEPVARAAGVDVRVHPPREVAALARELLASARGTVVVVGHSNTVPILLEELGVTAVPEIAHDEYDHLFLLPAGPGCAGPLVTLRLDGAGAEENE